MAVVVNEMEVVPAAPEADASSAGSRSQPQAEAIDRREVEHAVLKQMARQSRVRAH